MKKARKRQFKAAIAYFERLRNAMLLGHWTLHFSREAPDNDEAAASIRAYEVRNVATVKLGEGWYAGSREARRHYAVHELLHLHLVRLDYTTGDFEHVTDEYAWRLLWRAYHRQMELTVDGLADVLAPLLPLPDEEG